MSKTKNRRCCECTRSFVPNPRVGDRQVTCGDPECRRRRHSAMCRRWRKKNAEAVACHYEDVVKPFRARHPGYQRRSRMVRHLREIRDQITAAVVAVGRRLRRVLDRGRTERAMWFQEAAHVRATAGNPLSAALTKGVALADALAELGTLVAEFEVLGVEP